MLRFRAVWDVWKAFRIDSLLSFSSVSRSKCICFYSLHFLCDIVTHWTQRSRTILSCVFENEIKFYDFSVFVFRRSTTHAKLDFMSASSWHTTRRRKQFETVSKRICIAWMPYPSPCDIADDMELCWTWYSARFVIALGCGCAICAGIGIITFYCRTVKAL